MNFKKIILKNGLEGGGSRMRFRANRGELVWLDWHSGNRSGKIWRDWNLCSASAHRRINRDLGS